MARKPLLPDMDKKALEELAQQFPSTSVHRAAAMTDPPADAAPADPVTADPIAAAGDTPTGDAAVSAAPSHQAAEAMRPAGTPSLPTPPSPAAGASSPTAPIDAATLAAADTNPRRAARAWHEEPRFRSAVIGAVALLAGYGIGQSTSVGEDPLPGAIAQAVQAARREATDELAQLRTSAAITLREAEQRGVAALAAAREQSVAEVGAARAEADRANAELAAFRAQRVEADRAIVIATAIAAAAEAGRGFSTELEAARQQAAGAPRLAAALDQLVAFAAGVPSRPMLTETFEPSTRRALILGEAALPASWFGRLMARFTGSAATDPAARAAAVADARTAMNRGDLSGAVDALSRLDNLARPAVEPWMSLARDRIALDAAVARATAALVLSAARSP